MFDQGPNDAFMVLLHKVSSLAQKSEPFIYVFVEKSSLMWADEALS